VSLEVWSDPGELYLSRAAEVSVHRPLFTGDVVKTSGVAERTVLIVAHPCSMRAKGGALRGSVLTAPVEAAAGSAASEWAAGRYARMPLPELCGPGSSWAVGSFDDMSPTPAAALEGGDRLACLSPLGLNILQQRLVNWLTRVEVPTDEFWDAFAHTYEEADLLEEWCEIQARTPAECAQEFDEWLHDGELYHLHSSERRSRSAVLQGQLCDDRCFL